MTKALVPYPEMEYRRPDMDSVAARFDAILDLIRRGEIAEAVTEWTDLKSEMQTAMSLNSVAYKVDTTDAAAREEKAFIDEHRPTLIERNIEVAQSLIGGDNGARIDELFGPRLRQILEIDVETFDSRIKGDMKEVQSLCQEYTDLKAGLKFEYDGEPRTLVTIGRYHVDADRSVRESSQRAKYEALASHGEELDRIYDGLVASRTRMARTLGHETYTPLGYRNMQRTDYGPEEVAVFRQQVVEHVVPFAQEIYRDRAETLGVDRLMAWDESVGDLDGGPRPRGDVDWIVDRARRMYRELHEETGEFFDMMADNRLFDLASRDGKAGGGFCTSFTEYGVPFIFANFNGTKGDVRVTTHECGHAFQNWCSRHHPLLEYRWPTMEACEIHSMGMEFLTWPWMELFFEDDADRFRRDHLVDAILFLPYGCAVDDFQHRVYANPEATPAERHAMWKECEELYLPQRDYGDLPFVDEGRFWQQQQHVYNSPFYYIDYVLAQTCALQYWKRSLEDRETALKDYLAICRPGGSQTFLELLETGNLSSPFAEGTLGGVIDSAKSWLEKSGSGGAGMASGDAK